MRRLLESIHKKRPDLWASNNWILHHNNTPTHTACIIRDFFTKHGTTVIAQAPYSADMAPCDFFLFPKLKLPLRGTRFDSIEDIEKKFAERAERYSSSRLRQVHE